MTLPDLIDNFIAASWEEMPEEARKSLDDAIKTSQKKLERMMKKAGYSY